MSDVLRCREVGAHDQPLQKKKRKSAPKKKKKSKALPANKSAKAAAASTTSEIIQPEERGEGKGEGGLETSRGRLGIVRKMMLQSRRWHK